MSRCCFIVLLLIGCDVPTDTPRLQSRFLIPGATSAVALRELLPANVQEAGTVLRIALAPQPIGPRRLSDMCGAPCIVLHGQQAPKPAFTDSTAVTLPLPTDVLAATVSGGTLDVALTHNLGFDVLRPPGAAQTGTLRVTIRSGTRVVGTLQLQEPFASGATLRRAVTLQAGEISSDLVVSVVLSSPAGGTSSADWVRVDANAAVSGTVTPVQVDATEARVRLQSRQVSVEPATVDLTDVDQSIVQRTRGGAAVLVIDNPFAASGTLELRLTGGGVDVRKTFALSSGQRTQRVEFSQSEMQQLLGRLLTLQLTGPVTGAGGVVTLRAGQDIGVTTRFELLLEIG